MHLDRDACYRALLTRDARFDGRFFICVRTTGIYCRPICPVRTPKLANIVFVASAAAAHEAGFRPCLRCRPETSPDIGAWHGTASTVSRAVALIAAGAPAEDNVKGLAGRLGMGERQLRRLFCKHLGASPIAVAQSRRFLFAKQLITDTRLSMAEVALAAGYGSVRRFNDTFQQRYGRAPRSLRRGGGVKTAAVTLTLPYTPPYDWSAMIGFLAARAIPGVEHVRDDCYARSIAIGGVAGSIAVRRARPGNSALVATIWFPTVAALPFIVERIRRIFDLGADPVVIGEHLAADPALARLVSARPGLRVPGAWDGFELAVRAILGQQITVGAATQLAGRVAAVYGDEFSATDGPGLRCLFPNAARLVGADIAGAIGMPRARAGTITALAAAVLAAPRLLEPGDGLEPAIDRLTALPGIGPWTAQYIAMRALREPDAFPVGDVGLLRALATPEGRPTPAELLTRAAVWRPWRAYAALHLWSADAAATAAIKEISREAAD